jgi:hypothetical protein
VDTPLAAFATRRFWRRETGMKAILDHFEGTKAVLGEIGTKKTISVAKSSLPKMAGEGSALDNTSGSWQLDNGIAADRRSAAADLVNELFK